MSVSHYKGNESLDFVLPEESGVRDIQRDKWTLVNKASSSDKQL